MNKDLQIAKKTIQTGIEALKKLSGSLNRSSEFSRAVNLCSKAKKIGITGIGKSKDVSLYLGGVMSSLNIPAIGMSLQDIAHGGLGFFSGKNDILIIFSKSGQSSELSKDLLDHFHKLKIKVIGISCNSNSTLLKNSTVKILLPEVKEAGGLLAPTSSSTMFACFGNAICMALAKRKKLTNKILKKNHPAGSIASHLTQVKNLMARDIPMVSANKSIRFAINVMSKKKLGIVCIKEKKGSISIIVDGDLRRHSNNLFKKKITQISTKKPHWISEDATALSAIDKMTNLKISQLLVAKDKDLNKKNKQVAGIITMLQCLKKGIK
tara:strand:+ start:7443 stop:8411 length:969 start_codon:yes stop_codon:yes gene_type:complete